MQKKTVLKNLLPIKIKQLFARVHGMDIKKKTIIVAQRKNNLLNCHSFSLSSQFYFMLLLMSKNTKRFMWSDFSRPAVTYL